MTSLFDSNVYQRRNQTPWARVDLKAFMQEMMFTGPVTWGVEYRPDVSTRQWYTCIWTSENGQEHRAEAQDWDLCLWRAAQVELQLREKLK